MKETILAVQAMQDYILEHIEEEISLADLAAAAHFSPQYAHRLFKARTGAAPAEYIHRLRLSEAAKQLKSKMCRIADTAMEHRVDSLDGFTRAFVREFGMTPSEYRRSPTPITLFIPYGVKFKELYKEKVSTENVRKLFIQIVCKPERKVIIKRGVNAAEYWDYGNEVGCGV